MFYTESQQLLDDDADDEDGDFRVGPRELVVHNNCWLASKHVVLWNVRDLKWIKENWKFQWGTYLIDCVWKLVGVVISIEIGGYRLDIEELTAYHRKVDCLPKPNRSKKYELFKVYIEN